MALSVSSVRVMLVVLAKALVIVPMPHRVHPIAAMDPGMYSQSILRSILLILSLSTATSSRALAVAAAEFLGRAHGLIIRASI